MYITNEKLINILNKYPKESIVRLYHDVDENDNVTNFEAIEVFTKSGHTPVIYFSTKEDSSSEADEIILVENVMGDNPDSIENLVQSALYGAKW